MWKRENESGAPGAMPSDESPSPMSRSETDSAPRSSGKSGERTVLSPSIVVRGEISGDEDLIVEGRIEGKIQLRKNAVTIGPKGRVAAEIHAHVVVIDGEVTGNVTAEEQVVLRKSSRVQGDLVAPRVTIEDGARYKGSIDMESKQRPVASNAASESSSSRPGDKPKDAGGPRPVDSKSTAQAS